MSREVLAGRPGPLKDHCSTPASRGAERAYYTSPQYLDPVLMKTHSHTHPGRNIYSLHLTRSAGQAYRWTDWQALWECLSTLNTAKKSFHLFLHPTDHMKKLDIWTRLGVTSYRCYKGCEYVLVAWAKQVQQLTSSVKLLHEQSWVTTVHWLLSRDVKSGDRPPKRNDSVARFSKDHSAKSTERGGDCGWMGQQNIWL